MEFYENSSGYSPEQPAPVEGQPKAWRIEEGDELTQDDLERDFFENETRPVREGQPMGGHLFGKGNNTSAANDKNNPSQYAGNTNPYFDRTEPMEEHPENSNFKDSNQQGEPDYAKAQAYAGMTAISPKPEPPERGDGENDRPHKGDEEKQSEKGEETQVNIAGPNELPDQQKVGEDVTEEELRQNEK